MYLVFDIGGTKMRLAVSSDGKSFSDPKIIPTPQSFEEGMSVFEKTFKDITDEKIKLSAGGIRRLDAQKERLVQDFRLPDWSGKPLKKTLENIIGSQVYLENDTAMVGLGEAVAGAGKGNNIVAYLTISTGVGGARIVKGEIDQNSIGFEPGHQIVDADWTIRPESKKYFKEERLGAFEALVSGTSIEKFTGQKPYDIKDQNVWDELSKILSYGINNTIVYWSPDVVVLGGGMMKSPGISIEVVKKTLRENLTIFPKLPDIKISELGDVGGLHGALTYLQTLVK